MKEICDYSGLSGLFIPTQEVEDYLS